MAMLYDAIVVGAGVEGSYTAYHLAKQGKKTLLLEQFPLPHARGSSTGHSRITRKAYSQPFYALMMKKAYELWSQLEKEAGVTLYRKTGLLALGQANGPFLQNIEHAIRSSGENCEVLSHKGLRERYPMIRYPDHYGAVYDPVGGVLLADKALSAIHKVFVQNGGEIRSEEEMLELIPGETITVRTRKGAYRTRSLVLSVGPWASKLLKPLGLNLPLKAVRVTACYWKEKKEGVYGIENGFPCIMDGDLPGGDHVYGLPCMEYPGHMKLCWHDGPPIDPDRRDDVTDESFVEATAKYAREHFPGLEGDRPSIREMCIYTWTPDSNPFLDTHPRWKNLVVGVGFSGHGFKLSPVVGKVLSELAMGRTTSYDLSPFSIKRFQHKAAL